MQIITSPITRYATEAKAAKVMEGWTEADTEGWTYTVVPSGDWFVIEVRDETGFVLGAL